MDNSFSQILMFWGDELQPLPSYLLETFSFSPETQKFLHTVGLPIKGGPLANNIEDYLETRFYRNYEALTPFYFEKTLYFPIAEDPDVPECRVCIEQDTNLVLAVATAYVDLSVRFMNSNIKYFLVFLQIYIEEWLSLVNPEPSNRKAISTIKKIRRQFNEIDPKALEDEESYWSVVLEDIQLPYT